MLDFTGERVVPWAESLTDYPFVLQNHLYRYAWATLLVGGKNTVELGSGTGYGSFILSFVARSVTGYEIEPEAVVFAEKHFKADNLSFKQADITTLEIPPAEFYVAFEVLEHLERAEDFLSKIQKLGAAGAALIWSLPVNDDISYHKKVFPTVQAAEDFMANFFKNNYYYQFSEGLILPKEYGLKVKVEPKYLLGVSVLGQGKDETGRG